MTGRTKGPAGGATTKADDRPFGHGSVATSGNSHALRIDKAFVRQNPELARTGSRVRFGRVGANTFVFRILDDEPPAEASDPVVEAYAAFLQDDMIHHPGRLVPLTAGDAIHWESLVAGVAVEDDEALSADATL